MYAYLKNGKHFQSAELPDGQKEWLHFDAESHTYTDERGLRYQSGTTFVASLDDRPFNAEKQSIECASQLSGNYADMLPADIQAQWRDTAVVGTELHEAVECCINNVSIPEGFGMIATEYITWHDRMRRNHTTKSERIIWDRETLLCGTADIVSFNHATKSFIIDDIKTYKKMDSNRKAHAEKQITLYVYMWSKLLKTPCEIGGIVLFEGYYNTRQDTPLQFIQLKNKQAQINPAIWAREYYGRNIKESEMLNISNGVKPNPKRVVVFGTPGIGKSTFASRFPGVVFIDVENSTEEMDVQRFDTPTNWNGVKRLLAEILAEDSVEFKTIAIDSIDWVESQAGKAVAKSKNKKHLSDIGFGKGDLSVAEEIKEMLDTLQQIQDKHGVHVIMTAHSKITRYDPPDMMEGYSRFEMDLTKHVSSLVSEWANIILFAHFESTTIKTEDGKVKGVGDGSKRMMYSQQTDSFVAKNRCGLDPVMPFAYKNIKKVIEA
jgi:hypothetical protein